LRGGLGADAEGMVLPTLRRVQCAVLALVGVLGLTSCATVVIGRPEATQPVQGSGGGEVTIVGAADGTVDDQARAALTDL
jgi:hypothetical protein